MHRWRIDRVCPLPEAELHCLIEWGLLISSRSPMVSVSKSAICISKTRPDNVSGPVDRLSDPVRGTYRSSSCGRDGRQNVSPPGYCTYYHDCWMYRMVMFRWNFFDQPKSASAQLGCSRSQTPANCDAPSSSSTMHLKPPEPPAYYQFQRLEKLSLHSHTIRRVTWYCYSC